MGRYVLNETAYFGAGERKQLLGEIQARGFQKAMVVSDADLAKFGVLKQVTDVIEGEIPYEVYTDVKANPTIENVKKGVAFFKKVKADFLIAVGGGSVMDTAKAVGIIINNPSFQDVVSLEGVADTKKRCVPIIALPTTAGTAAEVTINYVITDENSGRKLVCVDPHDIPVLAIVDAELMSSMPKGLTASTGMDALTHAIEGYITKGADAMSDMFHLKSIELIAKNLRRAVSNGKDTEAREGMALGSYLAGMGFSNVGLGCVHSMAHPLGARFDTPHGVANAVLLPIVMEFNMQGNEAKFADIAVAMGENIDGMSREQAACGALAAVRKLSQDVGIPKNITELGIPESALAQLSHDAIIDPCTGGNPRAITESDILALYQKAL